jgi:hypothetical protein
MCNACSYAGGNPSAHTAAKSATLIFSVDIVTTFDSAAGGADGGVAFAAVLETCSAVPRSAAADAVVAVLGL